MVLTGLIVPNLRKLRNTLDLLGALEDGEVVGRTCSRAARMLTISAWPGKKPVIIDGHLPSSSRLSRNSDGTDARSGLEGYGGCAPSRARLAGSESKACRACNWRARKLRSHCPARGVANASLPSSPAKDRSASRSAAVRERADSCQVASSQTAGRQMQTSMHGCGASRPPQFRQRQTTTVSAGESGSSRPASAGLQRCSAERADC